MKSFAAGVLMAGVMAYANGATDGGGESAPAVAGGNMPRFPPDLAGIKAGDGDVIMAITIDNAGNVDDAVVLESTHEAFADSALQAVADWHFPAVQPGATWPRREVLQFSFKRSGVVTTLSHADAAREGFVLPNNPRLKTVPLHQMDAKPRRLRAVMPAVPAALIARRGNHPLTINFVIDRQGAVRVPVVPATEDPELAQLVLDAVASWRYTPPFYNQESVAVEVTSALALQQK